MVWNNLATLSAFTTFAATLSTNFSVFFCVVGSLNPSANDPSSYTIIFPNSNSNGNPFVDSNLLGGTYSSTSLNFSKASCGTTISLCNLVACRPSYVYYYCCYKCCCKCQKCFGLVVVSIQSSHTSLSKCKWSSPSRNLMSCSLLTP
jgi:hypothetical protein